MEHVWLTIGGMTCEHCARTIGKHLQKDRGVKEVRIEWSTGLGEVILDPAATSPEKILQNPVFAGHYSARVAPQPQCCATTATAGTGDERR
ncbi:MAG: heavy-metal-associated domain-containing protein [Gemmatimonadetes bacterium]|nr:heavy-metal-associated domain-containing protein [Gemmatimonadota bacterium]